MEGISPATVGANAQTKTHHSFTSNETSKTSDLFNIFLGDTHAKLPPSIRPFMAATQTAKFPNHELPRILEKMLMLGVPPQLKREMVTNLLLANSEADIPLTFLPWAIQLDCPELARQCCKRTDAGQYLNLSLGETFNPRKISGDLCNELRSLAKEDFLNLDQLFHLLWFNEQHDILMKILDKHAGSQSFMAKIVTLTFSNPHFLCQDQPFSDRLKELFSNLLQTNESIFLEASSAGWNSWWGPNAVISIPEWIHLQPCMQLLKEIANPAQLCKFFDSCDIGGAYRSSHNDPKAPKSVLNKQLENWLASHIIGNA